MSSERTYQGIEIAIIGMSGQFPGSRDHREYWKNLCDGKELIRSYTEEEVLKSGIAAGQLADSYVKSFGAMEDKECFDHAFFEYRPEEVSFMDPQIRLFHEHCWKALEDAGYSQALDDLKTGLFGGAGDNLNFKIATLLKSRGSGVDPYFLSQITDRTFLNTLVSYKLNLRGPAFYVDTACSTSLAAVHIACRSLLMRECSLALAGGVSVSTAREKGYMYREGMIFSQDGHCRAFDKDASGTVGGEGVGVVALKRLTDAIKDRDHIYAVIRGSALNNDGSQRVGFTAPSVKGQADCIRQAHKLAGVDASSIGYVETHGTGTRLGDPIEIRALNQAFATGGGDKFCAIGSVKTNVGHLGSAAGVAGLIKAALSVKYKKIVPSLHFREANPEIDFAGGPFYVSTGLKDWHRTEIPFRAGVSSFGIGGTNVHMVLEESPEQESSDVGREYKLMTLSAKTQSALTNYLKELKDFISNEPGLDLANAAYTLQTGRKHFSYRKPIVFSDREELLRALESITAENTPGLKAGEKSKAYVFMFPGQGSQYVRMGYGLYHGEVSFREEMDRGFALLHELTGTDHKAIVFPDAEGDSTIDDTRYTQPIVFLFEYALSRLLMSWGIQPQYMIGHSVGEYVAACVSGVFSFEDALKLVVKRGALMSKVMPGSMLSASLSAEAAKRYLNNKISLASVNAPDQVVFSGDREAIKTLLLRLGSEGIPHVKLHTSHAFHSAMQDVIMDEYREELNAVTFHKPQLPFISNVTGGLIKEVDACSPDYWVRHLRETVQFSQGVRTLLSIPAEMIFVEVGAGHSLTALLRQHQADRTRTASVSLIRHIKDPANDFRHFMEGIGQLWANGGKVDWNLFSRQERRNKVSLPAYAFERVRYPVEANPLEDGAILNGMSRRQDKQGVLSDWVYYPVWRSAAQPSQQSRRGKYLLFHSDGPFTDRLKKSLMDNQGEWIEAIPGDAYRQESKNRFTIHPGQAADLEMLLAALERENIDITDIVYGWPLAIDPERFSLTPGNKDLDFAFFGLVNVAKAFSGKSDPTGKRMFILTDSLYKVTGNEEISHHQSLVLGLLNVIPQEYALRCINIDIRQEDESTETLEKLVREMSNIHEDRVVCLRYGKRWLREFHRYPVTPGNNTGVKQGGVYLITGGLGNVGYTLAKHLVTRFSAKIALVGRTKIGEVVNEKMARLQALQRSGEVAYFSGDVTDYITLQKIAAEVESSIGPVNGIIHAAAADVDVSSQLIDELTIESALNVFIPKIKGIENLYRVFRDRNPDFVWVTSSLAAVLGGLGYGSYASANAFMDHFILSKSEELPQWKSIDLGELVFDDKHLENESGHERRALLPAELCALFESTLAIADQPTLMESVIDLHGRLDKAYSIRENEQHPLPVDGAVYKGERPDLSSRYVAPDTDLEKRLVGMLEVFFGIEGIGVEDNFFELGGDSLKAMAILKRIKQQFHVNLALKDFFAIQNIRQLATAIEEVLWIKNDVEMDNEITI